MWRFLVGLLMIASPVLAQQQSTAYDALRVVGTQLNRAYVSRIISVTGSDGDPQPVTWRVLIADRATPSGVLEVEVANGRVVAQRPATQSVSSGEVATIKTAQLNLDSSGAFSVASHTADQAHTNFALISYTLRNERGNPTWLVTLHDETRRPIATIHIGANKGTVSRVEGLYRGANMAQVQEDRAPRSQRREREITPDDIDASTDDAAYEEDDGDVNPVKKEVKRMFHRSKREAQRMFGRVRSSFDDYFYRR